MNFVFETAAGSDLWCQRKRFNWQETFKIEMITQKLNGAMEVQVQRHLINKLAKLEDAIAISKSETITDWLTDPLIDRGRC